MAEDQEQVGLNAFLLSYRVLIDFGASGREVISLGFACGYGSLFTQTSR
jgi:hypothetical protein